MRCHRFAHRENFSLLARTACVCIPRVFPSKVDLRESGVATPVKMQNPWNTCWSFAATAAIDEASAKLGDGF